MTRKISLTSDLLRQLIRLDAETGTLYWKPRRPEFFLGEGAKQTGNAAKWNKRFSGRAIVDTDRTKRRQITILGNRVMYHAAVWAIHTGEMPGNHIDHIDCNPRNNRPENLRICTPADNIRNMKKVMRADGTAPLSRYKGVSFHVEHQKWIAATRVHLGYFESEEDAARTFDDFQRKFKPDFARLNFPQKGERGAT